jgi:rRNA small subunit pseudouridine methyltransferase Nep1
LNLIFTEAALELVPRDILHHPSVRRNAKRRNKLAEETLLDRTLHHYAMSRLVNSDKRGRPDIIHFCLLLAMGSPLNREGKLSVSINTVNGSIISVNPSIRPPRDCTRFYSLMEQLLMNSVVPLEGESLMNMNGSTLFDHIKSISPSITIALSSHGKPSNFENVAKKLIEESNPVLFIGAHPTGPMKDDVLEIADEVYSIHPESLEAWTVTSRIIYEYEKLVN